MGGDRGVQRRLETIAERLGSSLHTSSRVPLGTTTESFRIVLADGRTFAAQWRAGAGAARRARVDAALRLRLAAAGIPVPPPASELTIGEQLWVVTPWVEGENGRASLGDPERARRLAAEMGALSARLAKVDVGGLDLDGGWGTVEALGRQAAARIRALGGSLGAGDVRALQRAVTMVKAAFAGRRTTLAHGDFAPVNVIVGPDGAIRALVDWELACTSLPLLDVAWWGWIVRFHHPDVWLATWPTFLEAAVVEDEERVAAGIAALQSLRCLHFAAVADHATTRVAWLGRLKETIGWGDQLPS